MAAAIDDEADGRTAGRQADRQERKRWRADQKEQLDEMLPRSVTFTPQPVVKPFWPCLQHALPHFTCWSVVMPV